MWVLISMVVAIIALLAWVSARSSPPPMTRDDLVQEGRNTQGQVELRGRHAGAQNLPSSSQDVGRFDSLGGSS